MPNSTIPARLHFEDLRLCETFALGPVTVTADDIKSFARQFDPLPFHLDEEAGRRSLLGGLAASGWHTGALALRLLADAFLAGVAALGVARVENLKWRKPLLAGDTLSGTAVIAELQRSDDSPQIGLMSLDFTLRNRKDQVLMTMRVIEKVAVRDPSAPPAADAVLPATGEASSPADGNGGGE